MTALKALDMWITQGISTAAAKPPDGEAPATPLPSPGLPDNTNVNQLTDIHDIKPILDMGADWKWLAYSAVGLLAVLVLLALAWWFWKRRRRTPETTPPKAPPIAPDTEALDALDALDAENELAPKLFYFRLSTILRRYVERRFDFPAAEMTTEELLPRVDQLSLDASLATQFKAFCREADPIKFADAAAPQERLAQNLAFCRDFVRKTTFGEQDGGTGGIH
jgi:hypothetical protein